MDNVSAPVENGGQITSSQPTGNGQATTAAYVSINEAARIWGKNKGTISNHVKEGKLQKHDQPLGPPKLLLAELAQVYGPPNVVKQVKNGVEITTSQPGATVAETSENRLLEAVLEAKDETIRTLRDQLTTERQAREEATRQADRWHTAYQEIKALPAPVTTAATSPEAAPIRAAEPPRRGFLGLFRRAG